MARILVQCGHSAEYPPFVPYGGGAPGEATWTADLGRRLAARLEDAGVETVLIGSWLSKPPGSSAWVEHNPPKEATEPYDLALCLHYDANLSTTIPGYDTGCFADRWEYDSAAAEADRFIRIWERSYPEQTGISLHNERRNVNTSRYYAYQSIMVPPAILLEHGVGQGLDHATLFERIDEVARVDAACVLEYLGITTPEEEDDMAKAQELQAQIDQLNGITKTMQEQIDYKDQLLQQANSRAGVAEAEVERLTERLTNADVVTERSIVSVAVNRKDGSVDMVN
jgi:N-acetylmuramoyl-L-alanine amidase